MFEKIVIRATDTAQSRLDAGFLAECLIFYKHVTLAGNRVFLANALEAIGPGHLMELMRRDVLKVNFEKEQFGVTSHKRLDSTERHDVVRFALEDAPGTSELATIFMAATGDWTTSARLQEFEKLVALTDYKWLDQSALVGAIVDQRYVQQAVVEIIAASAPQYLLSAEPRVRVTRELDGINMQTNIDFKRLNGEFRLAFPSIGFEITPALMLSQILGALSAMAAAAQSRAELATNETHARINRLHLNEAIEKRGTSAQAIDCFLNVTVDSARAIRDAVNSKRVGFDDVLTLLDRADKFKRWLEEREDPARLLPEYYRATIANTWADKLPTRIARWSIFTGGGLFLDAQGLGGLGTAAGVGVSALDAFLVDNLVRGWRPHQFIEQDLRRIVKGNPF
jgi:hypothetical protein